MAAAAALCRAFGALAVSAPRAAAARALVPPPPFPPGGALAAAWRGLCGSVPRCTTDPMWKCRVKYTVRPVGMKKTGGRDHTGGRARPGGGREGRPTGHGWSRSLGPQGASECGASAGDTNGGTA